MTEDYIPDCIVLPNGVQINFLAVDLKEDGWDVDIFSVHFPKNKNWRKEWRHGNELEPFDWFLENYDAVLGEILDYLETGERR